ncbi:MAG TPA: DUF3047 domain-containing protein [Methylomirabilota bacterium]|jgi:hypothetical protein|nr:DUF3047 domain-containing protein [Methylomirabilota bacterium]
MTLRSRPLVPILLLALVVTALAADPVVVEDWSSQPVGTKGIPPPWQKQRWGSPNYEFVVVEDGGRKVLHLKSAGDSSNISKEIKGKVNLKETPVLEWSWKVVTLPKGGDSRRAETDDQAGQIYVTWPRFPEAVRSRVIGYIWDTTVPAGSTVKSQKTGTVTYVVVRSGPADLGKWLTERRNVREDFKRIYGEEPEEPAIVSVGIDSDDTKSTAESFVGPILFRKN